MNKIEILDNKITLNIRKYIFMFCYFKYFFSKTLVALGHGAVEWAGELWDEAREL